MRSEQARREPDVKDGESCRRLARATAGSPEDAEECVNDAYPGAWNAIPPARPDPLRPFIPKIVRSASLQYRERKGAAGRNGACGAAPAVGLAGRG